MKWSISATNVRRFTTMRTVMIQRSNKGKWNIYFFHTQHEVYPHLYHRAHFDVDVEKVNRVLLVACRNGIIPHIQDWDDHVNIFLNKPLDK